MLVISRIAASATSTTFHDTRRAPANPAKITASDRRSTRVSSRRPASDARPYSRAMPPSMPSSTWPSAIRPSPPTHPGRPIATATPAATLTANAAHVTCAGDRPSVTWQRRSSGRTAWSRRRPSVGAKSNMGPRPVHQHVEHEEYREHDGFLDLVGNGGEPAPSHPGRIRIQRHLLEAYTVVHRDVNREEDDRDHGAEEEAQRDDPQQGDRFLKRRAPVVSALVPEPHGAEVERRLDRVIHVHADAEGVGEHLVPSLEAHRLDPQHGGEEVRDGRHGAAARCCARRPENHTRASPPPIQTRSRSRLTMAV